MKELLLISEITKIISCYKSSLPLHQDCPYDKKEIDTLCNLCCRKQEKVVKVKTLKETHLKLKGWKKILFKLIFGG